MRRDASRYLVVLAVLVGVVLLAGTPRLGARRTPPPSPRDECDVSECGADGVPLSLYAG